MSRSPQPNTAQIRRLLNQAFDDPGLDVFCQDYFPAIFDRFSRGMRKDEKITLLLDHCRRADDFDQLLNDLESHAQSNTGITSGLETVQANPGAASIKKTHFLGEAINKEAWPSSPSDQTSAGGSDQPAPTTPLIGWSDKLRDPVWGGIVAIATILTLIWAIYIFFDDPVDNDKSSLLTPGVAITSSIDVSPIPTPTETKFQYEFGPALLNPKEFVLFSVGEVITFTWQDLSLEDYQYYDFILDRAVRTEDEEPCVQTQTREPKMRLTPNEFGCTATAHYWSVSIVTDSSEGIGSQREWRDASQFDENRPISFDQRPPKWMGTK